MHKHCFDGDRVFVIHDFLSADECDDFVKRSEGAGYEEATITTTAGFVLNKVVRDNARLILDDALLANRLWLRAKPFLPRKISDRTIAGLNERFRFYRYDPGQKFEPHFDGYFQRNERERSELTFMVYLNGGFAGGETKFYTNDFVPSLSVIPERGMALVFVHLQVHEGAPVTAGRKYVLRTDVMYTSGGTSNAV